VRLRPPEKVEKLQKTLHAKAKDAPDYRFYALYDKMYRADVLRHAFDCCRANDGKPGVDGQTFGDIEQYGVDQWLGELTEELRAKRYVPQPVRRVYMAKPGQPNKTRPLGIPTIKDRVVMTAMLLVLEPIFEADLLPEQYAYRSEKSALDAVHHVQALVRSGHKEVIDADLSGYFDSIPHAELIKSVARRISDSRILRLIKLWLQAPVEETDTRGRTRRTTVNKDTGRGTAQGSPISPLLANLYMRRFVLGWKTLGHEKRFQAKIVNYADDLVICCRHSSHQAMQAMRSMMRKLKLTINEEKTHVCKLPKESFDFLSYTFGECVSWRTGKRYLTERPSKKKVQALRRRISELTARKWCWRSAEGVTAQLNRMLVGWANYFCSGPVGKPYSSITKHARRRLRRWLCLKHKVQGSGWSRFPDAYLHQELGLVQLRWRDFNRPRANA